MRYWKIRVAAAAIVIMGIIGAGMYWLESTQSVAFADVARVVLDTKTATYKMTASGKMNGKEVPVKHSDGIYMDPGRARITSPESIIIYDSAQGKWLMLQTKAKVAMLMTGQNVPKEPQAGNMFEQLRDRMEKYQSGQKGNVTDLGKKTIGGRKAIGYRMDMGGFPMTIWADAQTKLPLTIDMTLELTNGAMTMSMTDFAWGVPVDERLFSLAPPKDYTVQESRVDMSNPTEQDVIQMLRTWSSYMDGALPAKVDMSAYFDLMKPLIKSVKLKATQGQDREPTTQEIAAIQEPAVKVIRGIKFVMALPPGSDWHYVGKDAKLNAPDTPIAWYRPQKSETYRVIYADMTVKDVPPGQLSEKREEEAKPQAASQPATQMAAP